MEWKKYFHRGLWYSEIETLQKKGTEYRIKTDCGKYLQEFKNIGLDTARSVLEKDPKKRASGTKVLAAFEKIKLSEALKCKQISEEDYPILQETNTLVQPC